VPARQRWFLTAFVAVAIVAAGCGGSVHDAAPSTVGGAASPSAASSSAASPGAAGPTSPPASPPAVHSSAHCVTSGLHGKCGPYDYAGIAGSNGSTTYVLNNMWNAQSATTQTLTATSPGNWTVVARADPPGYTGVQTYPDTQQIYTTSGDAPDPLSNFGSIVSSFTENMHAVAGTSAEAAYDIWLGQNTSTNYADEVMIWNDQANRGTCGGATVVANANFGGSHGVPVQNWTLCKYGSSELIWYLTHSDEASGVVDVLPMLSWLQSHDYLPPHTGLNQIDYGFEICSTPGPETFDVSRFAIDITCKAAGAC
jgi:hypothetical protein